MEALAKVFSPEYLALDRTRMILSIIEDRLRSVWAILIGMSVLVVSVEAVTIMIHDRLQ